MDGSLGNSYWLSIVRLLHTLDLFSVICSSLFYWLALENIRPIPFFVGLTEKKKKTLISLTTTVFDAGIDKLLIKFYAIAASCLNTPANDI